MKTEKNKWSKLELREIFEIRYPKGRDLTFENMNEVAVAMYGEKKDTTDAGFVA